MEVIGWQSVRSVSPLRCLGFLGFEFPWLTPWANFCRAAGAGDLYEYSFGRTPRAGRASSAPTKRGEEGTIYRAPTWEGSGEEDLGFGFDDEEGVVGGVAGVAELLEGVV